MKHLKNRCKIWKHLKGLKIQTTLIQKWGQRGIIMFILKKIHKYKILIKLTKTAEFEMFFERGRDWQLVKILDSQNHQEGLPEAKLEE